ncbi:oxygen-sensing cyclic-di-GMP phosphodiesterase [Salmonella enterica subsp. enterica serovar Montevideo]|nr:oxygen-sensing cyclic-di-GMP phosphodiesterase [Salmonella enterica subsp. enterica serovar Montevideo]EEK7809348.1 oxygen-sensing cyclic-di-GMP phosphodiesterase [Salmonella enterica subsp. enterica serovar Montevideo]
MRIESVVPDGNPILLPALEQSILAAVLVDENDCVLFFNQAAERFWGYERHEVLGKGVLPLLPESLRGVYGGYVRKDREGGLPKVAGMSWEVLMEHKNGQQVWAVFSLSKIDLEGRIYYLALVRDVSDEVAMREQNRMLLIAVNNTDRPVLGWEPSSFLTSPKMPVDECRHFHSRPCGRERFQDDALVVSRDGKETRIRVSSTPIASHDDDGFPGYSVDVITEERQIRDLERAVLTALTSSLSFSELGDYFCRRIESIASGVLVSVFRVAERRLRLWAAPSFHASYGLDWEGIEIGEGVAGCGTAAHRGEPVMIYDIETDPLWEPYKHKILPHGYKACWTYPVKRRDGSVAGTFAFYFRQGGQPDAHLERIADASIHLCALAIEREENQQRVNQLVRYDILTGLPNRSLLCQHINELLLSNPEQEIAFFYLGLDRFKDINDTLGHASGDLVLVETGNRLKSHLDDGQFLARVESVMFVLVVPDCDVHRAALVAAHLQRVAGAPMEISGFSLDPTVSIGISQYPESSRDRDDLLRNAKSAMGRVKASGGGEYLFFSVGMNEAARDRLLLGTALRRAIAGNYLRLEYQPQVRPDSGELYGVEALARWRDPEFGVVPPDRFISLAEEIGEIEAIGRWALREACRQMAGWRDEGVQVPVVSVNLSPLSFRSSDLPDFVAGLLHQYALSGECLTIEITESAAMALTSDMLEVIHGIRALGVGLSVDDFGTGFSSLSNLANLPVTEVKIDCSFIDKCLQESRLQSLVMAVIGIGQNLHLTVVAEGVETEAQREMLKAYHCPVLQGYLFSRPLAPADIPNWIRTASDAPVRG